MQRYGKREGIPVVMHRTEAIVPKWNHRQSEDRPDRYALCSTYAVPGAQRSLGAYYELFCSMIGLDPHDRSAGLARVHDPASRRSHGKNSRTCAFH